MIRDHLQKRHINLDIHKVWIHEGYNRATFPIWNLSGVMVGYARYWPYGNKKTNDIRTGKYFIYYTKPNIGVWGLESWKKSNTLLITEGIFDAARFTNLGLSSIAVLGSSGNRDKTRWIWNIQHTRPTIAICDGDKAGMQLAKLSRNHIQLPAGTDPASAPTEVITDIMKRIANL